MSVRSLAALLGLFLISCQSDRSNPANPESVTFETATSTSSTTTSTTSVAPPTTPTLSGSDHAPNVSTPTTDIARFAPIGESTARNSEGPPTAPQPPAPADFVPAMHPVTAERLGLSWHPDCPVTPDELRILRIRYLDFGGVARIGELILNEHIASEVMAAFEELFQIGFAINRVETPERYARPEDFGPDRVFLEHHGAADLVNDTSGFFCRRATGSSAWSQHAFGLAVDINPVQNPYIKGSIVIPSNGAYSPDAMGTLRADSAAVEILENAGLTWGGNWRSTKDYMHFSLSGR